MQEEHEPPAFAAPDEVPLRPVQVLNPAPQVERKRDVEVMRMERRLLSLYTFLLFLAITDLCVRAAVVQELPVVSQLLRLDTFVIVFLLAYALVRMGLHMSAHTYPVTGEASFHAFMMHTTGVAMSLASIPVVFSEYSWIQFADLTVGSLYIPLLCFAAINLLAVNVEVDVTAKGNYTWKMWAVNGVALLLYCFIVIVVNRATDNTVFPYTFVATTGHVKYWFFPLMTQVISLFNFVVTRYVVSPYIEKMSKKKKTLRDIVRDATEASGAR